MVTSQIVPPEPIRIIFAKGTDVGRKRGHNEDYVDAFSPPDPDARSKKGDLFVIADGMGGHQAGEVASQTAVETISRDYYADPEEEIARSIVRAIQRANAAIHQHAQESPSRAGMGTTVVAAVVRGQELCLANVGDSRAYLVRGGTIRQITRDHSFVEEQIRAGILTREEAKTHPQRNVITRALGAKPEVEVDTHCGTLLLGDRILLCTDGLSEYVQEGEIQALLNQHSPQEATQRLIALANERGGNDNITALVVQAGQVSPAPDLEDTMPVTPLPQDAKRRGLSVPLIAGLAVGGVAVVAAVAAGALYLAPMLGLGRATATPTVQAPEPTAQATMPPPTVTPPSVPSPTGDAPTSTLAPGLELMEPADETTVVPGTEVTFRWRAIGMLPGSFSFAVMTSHPGFDELCRSDHQEACTATLQEEGDYRWWAELQHSGQVLVTSSRRTLHVRAQPTAAPSATFPESPLAITVTP